MGQPLRVAGTDMAGRHLTIVIYWRKRTGIDSLQNGHSALIIDTMSFDYLRNDYYLSWCSTGTKMVNRADAATFHDDMGNWGGSPLPNDDLHVPNRWVALKGLNIGAMKAAWDAMRTKERAHWKLFDKNCATAVARILKAGGGDDFATAHKHQMVWWPTDVMKYARSMGSNVFRTS
jgi:hypothetical protein